MPGMCRDCLGEVEPDLRRCRRCRSPRLFHHPELDLLAIAAHPDKGLAPVPGTNDHGIFLAWLCFMSSNIYPAINLAFHGRPLVESEAAFTMLGKGGEAQANRLFDTVDERLGREGPYILGESFSAADIYLFMLGLWAKPSERALHERCRNIARVGAEVRRRPKLRATLEVHGVAEPQG